MSFRTSVSAIALLFAAACTQGSDIASPGSTTPTTPPAGGGGGSGSGGGGSSATCPTGFSTGADVAGFTVCNIGGTLTQNTTIPFVDGAIYKIDGRLNVGIDTGADGTAGGGVAVDLEIEPGVVLFGSTGQDYIVVNRGSRILADGTESQPIIMTSELDLERRAADPSDIGANFDGEWGGLVILGSAPNNRCITGTDYFMDGCQQIIEGVSNPNATYGGDDDDDDSGILRYLQVRFAGNEISTGNELNGISFGGVGNSTIVDYVQVYNNSDDGVEFFGGTVDAKHLVLVGNDDESIDTDNGYQGTIQYAVVKQTTGRGDNITEQSSVTDLPANLSSNPLIANFTWIGTDGDEAFKSNTGSIGRILNGIIVYDNSCTDIEPSAGNNNGAFDGTAVDPSFDSVLFDCGNVSGTFDDSGSVAATDALAAGANNVYPATNSLSAEFFPGVNETGVTPVASLPAIDAAFEATDYIGAFDPDTDTPTDNWATGWTFGLFQDPACPTGTSDSGTEIDGQKVCVLVGGDLTEDLTLTRGNIYELDGRLNVGIDVGPADDNSDGVSGDPAILTIEAGVTIFGNSGADYIVVNRGSELRVNGTAANPVVMTSEADVLGTQPSPADADGEWGGLVILGQSYNNRCITGTAYFTDSCQQIIEGVSNPNATYGGSNPNDSSGWLRYLQVKYAGNEISTGNELNGISFGGVGDGTTVEYVQVHNNSDDGVEFFGGTVNVRYLVLTGNDDESIDTDNGYQGAIQYAIVVQTTGRGDNITEQSSVAGLLPSFSSNPLIANFTWIGTTADEAFKSNSGSIGQLLNGVIVYDNSCTDVEPSSGDGDGTFDGEGIDSTFNSVLFDCGNVSGTFDDDNNPVSEAARDADPNNVYPATNSLINTFINGPEEANVTPVASLSAIDPFFEDTGYVGAVENANDTWWAGWSCGIGNNEAC